MRKIQAQAPGKLFLAGEYAVVHSYQPAIIMAVDRVLTVTISETREPKGVLITNQNPTPIAWQWENHQLTTQKSGENFPLIWHLITTVQRFARLEGKGFTEQPFNLTITSELDHTNGQKLGLGSSGALSVALVKALLAWYQLDMHLDTQVFDSLVFKLIAITHREFGLRGSLGDVACAITGGILYYTNFDREWFTKQEISDDAVFMTLLHTDWPGLILTPLLWPKAWYLNVVWSTQSVSTEQLLQAHADTKSNEAQFLADAKHTVEQIQTAINHADWSAFKTTIQTNFEQIKAYTAQKQKPYLTSIFITAEQQLRDKDAIFKIAGAGAGDCAYAITNYAQTTQAVQTAWKRAGLTTLDLNPYYRKEAKDAEKS